VYRLDSRPTAFRYHSVTNYLIPSKCPECVCYVVFFNHFSQDFLSQFEDNEVGFVTGRVTSHASSTIPILEPSASTAQPSDSNPASIPRGRILGSRPTMPLSHSTMIGELKLTALKSRLASVGVQAELIGEGVLICGAGAKKSQVSETLEESVAVRKTARGRVELEGNVSDVYYIVRKEIYNLHALVAA
jgi:cleavage and polyadenylation specificity factor subunit 2